MTRPDIIKPRHLERLAVGYGRQSTQDQVEKNTGSTDYQRAQLRFALEWGWPPERTRWLDDFGLTGTAAEHRPDYQQLRRWIREGLVGIVCVSDHSRLGRDAAEWLAFVADCLAHDVLIAIDGRIVDLGDTNDRLHTSLMAVLAEHDGLNRRDTLQRGRSAKLMRGESVSYPPVGYVRPRKGAWELDPDPAIRAALPAVFRVFVEVRSLHAAVARLRELGIKIPRRKPGHPVRWVDASIPVLRDILTNPNYTPDYYYRRRVDDHRKPRSAKGRYRIRKATTEEMKIIPDHHVGYVTRAQWAEIQVIFRTNTWSSDHTRLGDGHALVQGILRCAYHRNRLLGTHYKRGKSARSRSHNYYCRGDYDLGGQVCRRIAGGRLDDAIAALVLERLSPPSIAQVKTAFDRAMADSRAEQRHREIEKTRLRQRVADLEQKLDALDPDSFKVFKTIERNLEQATRDLEKLEKIDESERQRTVRDNAAVLARAEQLAPEVEHILEARTTTDRDRKALVRMVVRTIRIEKWGNERLAVRVKWNDGVPDKALDLLLNKGVGRVLVEMHGQGKEPGKIAEHLNALGVRTRRGKRWTPKMVRQFIWRRSRKERRAPAV